jgi:hypothetical protein
MQAQGWPCFQRVELLPPHVGHEPSSRLGVTSVLTLTLPQPGRWVIEAKLNRSELKRRPGAHHRQPQPKHFARLAHGRSLCWHPVPPLKQGADLSRPARKNVSQDQREDWPAIVEQFAVSVGASLADPMVAKLVSPEMFLDLLRDGKPSNVLSEDAASVRGLSSEALKNLWRV